MISLASVIPRRSRGMTELKHQSMTASRAVFRVIAFATYGRGFPLSTLI
jgi:hypothetical protein